MLIKLCVRMLLGAGLITLSACTTLGPDFETPPADLEARWSEAGESLGGAQLSVEWWSLFDDAVLDQLVESAYRQNLPLQIAGLRIFEARAQLGIAIGQQYPQGQQLNGNLTRVELSENAPNFFPNLMDDRYTRAGVGLDANWELDFWGRYRRGVESASASLGASIADYDNALVSLTAEVARTYVVLRTLQERLAIARSNTITQTRSYRLAEVRFSKGAVSELDSVQALSLLESTQSTLPQLESRIRQAKHALSILLGKPPGELQALLQGDGVIPQPPATLNAGVPADLLRRRPDIRRAELQAAARSGLIGVARSDLYPRFSLVGSIGLLGSDSSRTELNDLFSSDSLSYTGGPSVSWNILNYGRVKNQVRVQDARLEAAIVDYQNTVLEAAREVEDGLSSYAGGRAQSEHLAKSVNAAQQAVQLALLQYREGAVDYQRVLDTQKNLLQVQDAYTTVRGEVAGALIAVYKALGGGWQIRAGQPFVSGERQKSMRQRTDWGHLMDSSVPGELPAAPPTGDRQPLFNAPDW